MSHVEGIRIPRHFFVSVPLRFQTGKRESTECLGILFRTFVRCRFSRSLQDEPNTVSAERNASPSLCDFRTEGGTGGGGVAASLPDDDRFSAAASPMQAIGPSRPPLAPLFHISFGQHCATPKAVGAAIPVRLRMAQQPVAQADVNIGRLQRPATSRRCLAAR